jgi:hypothetical protein
LSWVTDLWKILETAATLTREVERADREIEGLRRDVNTLTLTVSQLKSDLTYEKAATKLVLYNYANDGRHLKESIDAKFDVLVTRLDSKMAAFENRMPPIPSEKKPPSPLKNGSDN